jgi:hypothetical protein
LTIAKLGFEVMSIDDCRGLFTLFAIARLGFDAGAGVGFGAGAGFGDGE